MNATLRTDTWPQARLPARHSAARLAGSYGEAAPPPASGPARAPAPAPARVPAVAELRRLLAVLDEALDLPPAERVQWLAALRQRQPEVAERFVALLHTQATTGGIALLERGAASTLGLRSKAGDSGHAQGHRVGRWRLVREIGRGGMGQVWLARPASPAAAGTAVRRALVALKLPLVGLHGQALLRRFEHEREVLLKLAHPHIGRLLDAGVAEDGQPWLALQYVRGQALDRFCREQRVPLAGRVRLVLQVMSAVQHAHEQGVLHRDIKPSNVLVTRGGRAMLLDFGIARLADAAGEAPVGDLTQDFGRVHSLHHAAPEQVACERSSVATDVWALGALLYELVCEERPFPGLTRSEIEAAIRQRAPEPPSKQLQQALATREGAAAEELRAAVQVLDEIVLRALQKDPALRHATVAAMRGHLLRWLHRAPPAVGGWFPTPRSADRPAD